MLKYICHFPYCTYCTNTKSKIEFHHIIPKELWPQLNQNVTLSFCPTHHRLIYHPKCHHGPHSINSSNSLQIKGIFKTNKGYAVIFIDNNNNEITNYFNK